MFVEFFRVHQHSFYVQIIVLHRDDQGIIVTRDDANKILVREGDFNLWLLLQTCLKADGYDVRRQNLSSIFWRGGLDSLPLMNPHVMILMKTYAPYSTIMLEKMHEVVGE